MRTRSKVLIAVGAALAVLAGLWALIAPAQLVKYPSNVDKTAVATGTFSLAVNPSTGAPLAKPQTLPLSIRRHLRVLSSTGSQAVVKEDDLMKIGTLPQQDAQQQYVLDRTSLRNVPSRRSYAFGPTNVVNRAPVYSISFPFDTSSGPYQIWKNEVGRSYTFRQQGAELSRDGVTLIPLHGQVTDVPAQPSYLAQLSPLGHLPTQTTIAQLGPQLKALGVDPAQLRTVLLPQLSARDRATLSSALAQPIPLHYVVSANTRVLVEPTTGAVVSLDRISESLGVQPQLSGLSVIGTVLGQSAYGNNPIIIAARQTLAKLAQSPPTATVFSYTYRQTPASVADIASYAKSGADQITAVRTTIPLAVLLLGVLSAAIGLLLWLLERRGRDTSPQSRPPAGRPAVSDTTPPRPAPVAIGPRRPDGSGRSEHLNRPRTPQRR